ncbi:MAG: aminotransferase class IV [Hydrotalea sp.]|nr:aminotransferase class IV [Hydrotalea sp.]
MSDNNHSAGAQSTTPPITHCMVDGELLPVTGKHLSLFDRGFSLADGLFETILIRNGRVIWWQEHMARLTAGAGILRIHLAEKFQENLQELLLADVERLLRANHADNQKLYVLRITLTRGVVNGRGLWPGALQQPSPAIAPTITMALTPHPAFPHFTTAPVAVTIANVTRKNHRSPLSAIKWLGGYGDNLLARAHCGAGVDDALLLNTADNLVSATVGNVFLLFADGWRTPAGNDGIIPGIARQMILASGIIKLHPATINQNDIKNAKAGFISNSLSLSPIKTIDGRPLPNVDGVGAVCADLARLYGEL